MWPDVRKSRRLARKQPKTLTTTGNTSRRVLRSTALPSRHLPTHVQFSLQEDFNLKDLPLRKHTRL